MRSPRRFLFAVSALLLATLAGAALATAPTPNDLETRQIYVFRRGVRVGTAANASGFTNVTRGTLDYDFPTLGGTMLALDTYCAESSAMTVTGVRFGDSCSLGIDQVTVNAFGNITPYVTAADTVKLRACASGITDGGSFNQPDSGYKVVCFGPAP